MSPGAASLPVPEPDDPQATPRKLLRVVGDCPPATPPGIGSDGPAQLGGAAEKSGKAPPPPPPPPLWLGEALATSASCSEAVTATEPAITIQRLELELAAARDEARALHQMLEDLPGIFERKFLQRLQVVRDHQQHLLVDNQALRERLYALGPAPAGPASGPAPCTPRLALPAAGRELPSQGLRHSLRTLLSSATRLGRNS